MAALGGSTILIAACVVAGSLLVGARLVIAGGDDSRGDEARVADPNAPSLVALAPPRDASARSFDAAVAKASSLLGNRARNVLDADRVGNESVRARAGLEPDAQRIVVGEIDELEAVAFPVDAVAKPARALRLVTYPERVQSNRVFRATLRGAGLDPAAVRASLDGAAPEPARAQARASGEIDVTLGPLVPGKHRIEIGASDREPPIRIACEAGPPPRVISIGDPQGLVARALAAQGFQVDAYAGGAIVEDAALVLAADATAIPEAEVIAALGRGAGVLIVGGSALARASGGQLASALPARAKKLPPPESDAPGNDAPGGAHDPPGPEPPKPEPPKPEPPKPEPPKPEPPKPEPVPDAPKTDRPKDKTPPNAPPPDAIPKPQKKETDAAKVALALVLDHSGSMTGEKLTLAKQAALASAQILAVDDYLTVVSFDTEASVIVRLDIPGSPALLRQKLERIQPGGGTSFYPALLTAREQLLLKPAAIRHIVLLTDGGAQDRDTADFRGLLTRTFFADGITLSSVFVTGEGDQDPNFLGLLAKWGRGRSYPVMPGEIPQMITLEVRRVFGLPPDGTRRVVASPSPEPESKTPPLDPPKPKPEETPKPPPPKPKPQPPKRPTATVVAEPDSAIVERLDLAGLPPVESFVELEERTGAAVVLRASPQGSALMAARASGPGSVAVIGIDEKDGLDKWEKDPRLLELLARSASAIERTAPSPAAPAFEAVVDDGVAYRAGDDTLGLIPEIPEGRDHATVGGSLEGETRRLPDGWRTSSIRAIANAEPRADVARGAAALRAAAAAPASGPAPAAAISPSASREKIPALATALLCGAALAIVIGAAAARRGN